MDRPSQSGSSFNPFEMEKNMSLNQILKTIDVAKDDDRIKGIYLQSKRQLNGLPIWRAFGKS